MQSNWKQNDLITTFEVYKHKIFLKNCQFVQIYMGFGPLV